MPQGSIESESVETSFPSKIPYHLNVNFKIPSEDTRKRVRAQVHVELRTEEAVRFD